MYAYTHAHHTNKRKRNKVKLIRLPVVHRTDILCHVYNTLSCMFDPQRVISKTTRLYISSGLSTLGSWVLFFPRGNTGNFHVLSKNYRAVCGVHFLLVVNRMGYCSYFFFICSANMQWRFNSFGESWFFPRWMEFKSMLLTYNILMCYLPYR